MTASINAFILLWTVTVKSATGINSATRAESCSRIASSSASPFRRAGEGRRRGRRAHARRDSDSVLRAERVSERLEPELRRTDRMVCTGAREGSQGAAKPRKPFLKPTGKRAARQSSRFLAKMQ